MSSSNNNPRAALLDQSNYVPADDGVYPEYSQSTRSGTVVSINDEDEPAAPKGCWANFVQKVFKGDLKVAGYALGLLISSTGNSIMFKKMENKMANYPLFLNQLSTSVYIPIFFGIVFWEFQFTNWITPTMTSFPKKKFLFMGLFDALSGICMLFGGIHTSGSFQALLLNAVIPFTMALSIIFLSTKYLRTQYAGASIIMAGVMVVIIPTIIDGGSAGNSVIFNFIFLLSTIPQAFSSIYKEIAFGDIELDVNYLQAWVAFFQFFLSLALTPLNSLPFLEDAYVPFNKLPEAFSNGGLCLHGVNSIILHNVTETSSNGTVTWYPSCWVDENNKMGAPENVHCDDCVGAWLPTFLYICFNCFYNLFIVLVIKYGSAALLWIILTLRLPLVQIAFAISFINNPPDTFRTTSIIGLFVIIFGLVLYRWSSVAGGPDPTAAAINENDEDDDKHAIIDPNMPTSASFNQRLTHSSAAEF